MQRRGKYIFWTLVVLNSFLIVTFVLTSQDLNREFPPSLENCFKDCLLDVEPISSSSKETRALDNVIEKSVDVIEVTTQHLVENDEHPWKRCPEPGLGLESTFLTCSVDGRLGNVVWSYLSLWASAKRHNARPILNRNSLDFLSKIFNKSMMDIPTIEEMDEKCDLSGMLTNMYLNRSIDVAWRYTLFEELERPPAEGYRMLKFAFYLVNSEELVPLWNQLPSVLVLNDYLVDEAEKQLHQINENYTTFMEPFYTAANSTMELPEFVGVHVRRTDYMRHMSIVYEGSTAAGPEFFHKAMDWLYSTLRKPLIFVIVSDDADWAKENIICDRQDSFLAGTSDVDNPGLDLALLGACNHTIFAYGTFGLTGALLASRPGGFTVIFDPLNGTVTKEMEFAANLPGWRIMDADGHFNFANTNIEYAYYVHPRLPV